MEFSSITMVVDNGAQEEHSSCRKCHRKSHASGVEQPSFSWLKATSPICMSTFLLLKGFCREILEQIPPSPQVKIP